MKKSLCLSVFLLLNLSIHAWSQTEQNTTSRGLSDDPSMIQSLPPLEYPRVQPKQQTLPPPIQLPSLIPQEAEYLHPGILVYLNGKWEGSDHLLNLTNNIGINISIIKPEGEILEISKDQIRKEIEEIFTRSNIRPQTLAPEGRPPLPTFEMEIFVYPIERGYVAFCEGRLFESVILDRFKMDSNMAFQAITWEKQHLIVAPKNQFVEKLRKTIQDIASSFVERFQVYEKLKRNK